MSTQSDLHDGLTVAAGVASAAALAMPDPIGRVALNVTAAALGAAAAMADQGKTPEQIVAAIKRSHRVDTSVEDAAVDALVAAKPSARREDDGA